MVDLDDAIELLTRMYIEEHITSKEKGKDMLYIAREDLIKLSIKLLKLIKKNYN